MKRLTALLLVLGMAAAVPAAESTVFTDDFSNGLSGWTTVDLAGSSSKWHKITDHPMDTVSYHSPDTSWWCGVDADTFYGTYWSDALLVNKICDLSGCSNPALKFWHYLDIDTDSDDSATVEVSTDSGATWDAAIAAWTTSSGGWLNVSVDMSAYVDSVVRIRFRFTSDAYDITPSYGWFIDDIVFVDVTSESTVYTNDMENENDFTTYAEIGAAVWGKSTDTASSADTSYNSPTEASLWTCLQSKKFDFSGLNSPKLTFKHYYAFSFGSASTDWSSGGIVEITTDTTVDSAAWIKLYPDGGYPGYCNNTGFGNPLGNTGITGDADVEGYYGYQRSWQTATFDLTAYAGSSNVWIRLSAGTDQYTNVFFNEEQWYIDDFTIKDQGSSDTIYFNDMEDSNDVKLIAGGPVPGNWWQASHNGFSQLASSPAYYSADSAAYCGNQSSRYNKGEYAPIDNYYSLIDNALVSPFFDISGVADGDDLKIYFRNRRYAINNGLFIVDARIAVDSSWTPVDTFSTSTYRNATLGGWMPAGIDLSAFAVQDSLCLRLRAVATSPNSRLYWYVDDFSVVSSGRNLVDFADVAVNVPSYTLTEKSDTVNVFDIEVFDADGAAPETLTITVNDLGGDLAAEDFRGISNSLNSGISLFDSAGSRIAVDAGASGWNGLTATVVLQGGTAVPAAPVSITAYRVKFRTSATIPDSASFTVSLGTSGNLVTADNEMLGLGGSALTSGTFTVSNAAPAAPATVSALEQVDSTSVLIAWAPVAAPDMAVYNVYRDTVSGFGTGAGKLLATTATGDTDYVDSALVMGKTYYYKVTAVDSGGNAGDASVEDSAVTNRLPAMPANVATYEDPGEEFIRVFWGGMGGDVVTYNVYRDTVGGFSAGPANLLAAVSVPDTSYSDSAVAVGKVYYYVVSATDDVGGEGPVSGQVDSPVPVELTGFSAEAGPDGIVLQWTTTSETDNLGWNIYRTTAGITVKVNDGLIPGGGTTVLPMCYRYTDEDDGLVEECIYRLEQVGEAGNVTVIANVRIDPSASTSEISVYGGERISGMGFSVITNPGTDHTVLHVPGPGRVIIYSPDGRRMHDWDIARYGSVFWNGLDNRGNETESGVFVAVYASGTKRMCVKFIR